MTMPISEAVRDASTSRPEASQRPRSMIDRKPSALPIVVADDKLLELDAAAHWRETLYGVLCSLGVHLLLVLALAFLVFETSDNDVGSLLGILGQSGADAPADFILDSELNTDPGGSPEPEKLFSSPVLLSDSGLAGPTTDAESGGGGSGGGSGDGEGEGIGVAVPTLSVPSYAVTKGSFSAWTDPEDPKPGEQYFITIQVRLPDDKLKGKTYPVKDISGMVTGTDGYKKVIRFRPNEKIEVQDGVIEFKLLIPGAAHLVKDTIRIQSRMLKEKQTLQLVF